jgi:hypothetical protein
LYPISLFNCIDSPIIIKTHKRKPQAQSVYPHKVMTRLRFPFSVILSVTIATMALLLGETMAAQACPFQNSSMPLGSNLSQPSALSKPSTLASDDSKQWWSLDYSEAAGFGAVVGLFAIALFFKARYGRAVAPDDVDFLSKHPQLEHPEMLLSTVPQEAFASTFDADLLVVR